MARLLQESFGMKSVLLITVLLTFTMVFGENTVYIEDARYNAKTKAIEFNVQYGGGCAEHTFQLQVGPCQETYPVRCDAQLIDLMTTDRCKALIQEKVTISLQDARLDNNYYSGASLAIRGSGDSKAIITLPK